MNSAVQTMLRILGRLFYSALWGVLFAAISPLLIAAGLLIGTMLGLDGDAARLFFGLWLFYLPAIAITGLLFGGFRLFSTTISTAFIVTFFVLWGGYHLFIGVASYRGSIDLILLSLAFGSSGIVLIAVTLLTGALNSAAFISIKRWGAWLVRP